MNVLDVFLVLPLVYGAVHGWHRGLIRELMSLVAVAVAFWVANQFNAPVRHWLVESLGDAVYTHSSVAYGLCFVGCVVVLNVLARLLSKLAKKVDVGQSNAALGGVFGLSKWALLMSFLAVGFGLFQRKLEWPDRHFLDDSALFNPMETLGNFLIQRAPEEAEQQVQEALPDWASTASMPGNPRPSRYSSIAPPPVLT